MVGCDFLSNTIKSITTNTLKNSSDYPIFKESIRVYKIMTIDEILKYLTILVQGCNFKNT